MLGEAALGPDRTTSSITDIAGNHADPSSELIFCHSRLHLDEGAASPTSTLPEGTFTSVSAGETTLAG